MTSALLFSIIYMNLDIYRKISLFIFGCTGKKFPSDQTEKSLLQYFTGPGN